MEKTNGTALAYAPTSPSVPPPPTVMLWPYQEECVQRLLAAYERDRHGEVLLILSSPRLQADEKKLVLVDRSEASDMLDRRFAERERDREQRTVQKEAKRARKEKGKQSSRTTYTGRRAST